MENNLFREKSISKVSSPEQLNDYLRVSNPGVWMLLSGIIILLLGVCVWGIFGRLNTSVNGVCKVNNGQITCFLSEENVHKVEAGMKISLEGKEYEISKIEKMPVYAADNLEDYGLYLGGFSKDGWVYVATVKTSGAADGLNDGYYTGEITVESISPMSFITN